MSDGEGRFERPSHLPGVFLFGHPGTHPCSSGCKGRQRVTSHLHSVTTVSPSLCVGERGKTLLLLRAHAHAQRAFPLTSIDRGEAVPPSLLLRFDEVGREVVFGRPSSAAEDEKVERGGSSDAGLPVPEPMPCHVLLVLLPSYAL